MFNQVANHSWNFKDDRNDSQAEWSWRTALHLAVRSPASLDWGSFSDLHLLVTLTVCGVRIRQFREFPSVWACLTFVSRLAEVMDSWDEDRQQKAPSSELLIRGTWCQAGPTLLLWARADRWSVSGLCTVNYSFFPAWKDSCCAQPTPEERGVVLYFL